MKKPTSADVAQTAGVSIATVSRVINGNSVVDETLRQKVEAACRELSYMPNRHAQNIRGKNGRVIGVILPTIADSFFSHVLEKITQTADAGGLRVIVFSCHGDPVTEEGCIEAAFTAGIDGLLYCPSAEAGPARLFDFFPADFPIVIFYRREIIPGVPHIFHDNEQGGYLAAKYLLHQNRRSIAFFGSFWHSLGDGRESLIDMMRTKKRGFYSALDRLSGYIRALDEYGLTPREELLLPVAGFGFEAGRKGAKDFLSRICDFDAVFCSNDEVAAGVIEVLQEQNYAVPEAVSVIGYDDLSFATATRPMLTTIRQDPAILGEGAVEMILERMDEKPVSDRCIEASLIVRDSTAVKKAEAVL
jgi:DNA-binding LacI/PurR family transcriptional regulator